MSEFMSGRRIDRGFLNAVDYMTDWRSRFGFPKGQPIPQGLPTNMSDAIRSGAINKLQPVGEAVGGLTISPVMFGKAVGRGFAKIKGGFVPKKDAPELWPDFNTVREIAGLKHVLPKGVLKDIQKVKIKKEIVGGLKDSNRELHAHIKAQNVRYRGMQESDVIFTPRSTRASGVHEGIHSRMNAIKSDLTPRGIRADLIEKISENTAKKTNTNIAKGTWEKSSKEVYDAGLGMLNEKHARTMTTDVDNILSKAVAIHGDKALKSGKLRISDESWDALSDHRAKQILKSYYKTNKKEFKEAANSVIKNYKGNKRIKAHFEKVHKKDRETTIELEKIFSGWKTEGSSRKVSDSGIKRFPSKVGSPAEATKLGREYSLKELNRVMIKERKATTKIMNKAKGKKGAEWMKLATESQIPATRSQGAREAIESAYVTSKKGIYGETPFKPAEVNIWLTNQLKK